MLAGREKTGTGKIELPIFCSTDANADVTYEIWRFDVQC